MGARATIEGSGDGKKRVDISKEDRLIDWMWGAREGLGQFSVSGLGKWGGGSSRPQAREPWGRRKLAGGAVKSSVFGHTVSKMPGGRPSGGSRRHLDS